MNRKNSTPLTLILVWAVGALLIAPASLGQDAPPGDENGLEPADSRRPIREQTIYIPYGKLRKVFEKEGRGVFLPYEEFRELWDAAREKTAPGEEEKPPVGALITEIQNQATVAEDVVEVTAVMKIEVLGKGWHQVPLRLADAAITEATLDGRPARIVSDEGGYRLLVEKKGDEPQLVELSLRYAKSMTRAPGENSVSFQAPQAPVSRWQVRIPESGVKVNIEPLIAATEVTGREAAAGDEEAPEAKAEETVVLAFVGAAPTVRISWTPKAEGATGLAALASVQAQQQVTITEGSIRTRTELAYTISRAELDELTVEVPADQKVTGVFDANVRNWSMSDDRQTITVQLFEPARGSQNLVVELEKFTGDDEQERTLNVPVVRAGGVGRQQGVVVVRVAEGLRAEASRSTGLLQVDAAELPAALSQGSWAYAFRYTAVPYELALSVEKILPRVLVDWLVAAELQPEELTIRVFSVYTIERAGVFQFQWDVPAGYKVQWVKGREAAGAKAVQVESDYLEGDDQTRLVVNLSRKAIGRVGLEMELRRKLEEPNLLKPTGQAADIALELPRVAAETVERAKGRVIISAAPSLRVYPADSKDMQSVSFREATEGMQGTILITSPDAVPVLAFAFADEPTSLQLAAERRKPQVTVRQLLVVRVEEGAVKYKATFFYEVLYAGIESLRIDIPEGVASAVPNVTEEMRYEVLELPDDEPAQGYNAWSFSGETELAGKGQIDVEWEEERDKLAVVEVPRLIPRQVDLAEGQIVLVKAETIDLVTSGEPTGLRPIDPQQDLMPGADVPDAAAAFEFYADWELTIQATRYELEEVKHTSIERAVVRMVVTRADLVSVQALYRMRSARQRLVLTLPDEASLDADPRLNGTPVTLEKEGNQYFVPLVDTDPDESFLLELRFTVPGDGSRLDLVEFPLEPAVQQVYLCAYLPKEQTVLGKKGPWTEEFGWWLGPALRWRPANRVTDTELMSWVSDGAGLPESFPTDGRLYVFSTLRPEPPPGGSLRLTMAEQNVLRYLALGIVLIGGLVLVPARTPVRVLSIGAIAVLLIFLSVFLPIRAWQLIDGGFVAAVVIVLVVWLVWYFVRHKPWGLLIRKPEPAGPPSETPAEGETEKPSSGPEAPQSESPEEPQEGKPESATEPGEGGGTDA